MVSRRAALAGGAVAFGALGVGAGSRYRPGIDLREPPVDAWPMAGYGPSGTAANADASLPASPESAWSAKPLNGIYPTGLVADPERVYAAGDGVAALDRGDGATAWTDNDDVGGPAALAEGSLYVAPGDSVRGVSQAVVAFDARSGDRRWTAPSVADATSVLATDGSLFVGTESGLSGLDDSNGGERWSVAGPYEPIPVVTGGRLCATEGSPAPGGETVAFRRRSGTDVALGRSPSVDWKQDHGGAPLGVSATDGRLVVGVSRPAETAGPILMCHDIESGDVEWQATVPEADRDDPARGGPLAVSDGRCVAGYSGGDAVSGTDAVVCRAVGDGEPLWQAETEGPVADIAVVGDGVVFGTKNGIVRTIDLETGADRWRFDFVVRVHALAPVDGTVFVASRGGRVAAVR